MLLPRVADLLYLFLNLAARLLAVILPPVNPRVVTAGCAAITAATAPTTPVRSKPVIHLKLTRHSIIVAAQLCQLLQVDQLTADNKQVINSKQ